MHHNTWVPIQQHHDITRYSNIAIIINLTWLCKFVVFPQYFTAVRQNGIFFIKRLVFTPFYNSEAKVLPNIGLILRRRCYVVSHVSFCLPQLLWLPLLQECHCAAQQSGSSAPSTRVEVWKSYCIPNASKTGVIILFLFFLNQYYELKNQYIGQQVIAICCHIDIFSHLYKQVKHKEWWACTGWRWL